MTGKSSYNFIEGKRCIYHDGLAVLRHSCGEYLCKECIRDDDTCPRCKKEVRYQKRQAPSKQPAKGESVGEMSMPGTDEKTFPPKEEKNLLPKKEEAPEEKKDILPIPPPPKLEDDDDEDAQQEEFVDDEEEIDDEEGTKEIASKKRGDYSRL